MAERAFPQRRNLAFSLAATFCLVLYSLSEGILTSRQWIASDPTYTRKSSSSSTSTSTYSSIRNSNEYFNMTSNQKPEPIALQRRNNVSNNRSQIKISNFTELPSDEKTESISSSIDSNDNVLIRDHPHAGARDESGAWGYVPDVAAIRRDILLNLRTNKITSFFPLEPELLEPVCQVLPGQSFEGKSGYKLLRYIQLNGPDPVPEPVLANSTNTTDANDNNIANTLTYVATPTNTSIAPARILCSVYTHDKNHDRIKAITETWGWRCDGFFAASTKTEPSVGAIDLPHRGEEKYGNMWQKTRSILAFMYDHFLGDYDYFYLGGDDVYLIVENLRNYLHLLEMSVGGRDTQPLYIGHQSQGPYFIYMGGGPGYLLNRHALRRFVEEALPTFDAKREISAEDRMVGQSFKRLGIQPVDTADIAHRQRFLGLDPERIATMRNPTNRYYKAQLALWAKTHGERYGLDLISTQSVSFHHIKKREWMKRLHAIIYNSCASGTVLRDAQDSALNQQ